MCMLINLDEVRDSFQYIIVFPFFSLTVAIIRYYFDNAAIIEFPTKESEVSEFLEAFIKSAKKSSNLV